MPKVLRHISLAIAIFLAVPSIAQTGWLGALSGALKAGQALTITDEELAETVHKAVVQMDKENKICPSTSSYTKRLQNLTSSMHEAEGIELNFKVYQTKDLNAFACPDGSVRVYSALMDILSDDELLGVLGHEIGHVALRHSKRAWKWALLRSAASDAIGAVSETWANLSESGIGAICSTALSAKHSRYHETEADDFGYDFLKENGRNPWVMGKTFIKIKKLTEQENNSRIQKWLQAFSSHPDFDARISRMRERAEADGYDCQ